MSAPLMPPLLEEVGRRRFAFYPPIANAEPNEWQLRGATRTEVNAINTRTELEIWIPRHYLGTVSEIDDPILIVGLTKELEYREGAVWPRVRRVIEMPRAVNENPRPWHQPRTVSEPAAVVGIRLENPSDSRASRMLLVAGVGAVVVSLLAAGVLREWIFRPRQAMERMSTAVAPISFAASDDYGSIVGRWGSPASDRWYTDGRAVTFHALAYPRQHAILILMARAGEAPHYIGAMNSTWHVVATVKLTGGTESRVVLSRLPRLL
jgi:hypothetical protein